MVVKHGQLNKLGQRNTSSYRGITCPPSHSFYTSTWQSSSLSQAGIYTSDLKMFFGIPHFFVMVAFPLVNLKFVRFEPLSLTILLKLSNILSLACMVQRETFIVTLSLNCINTSSQTHLSQSLHKAFPFQSLVIVST